MKVFTYFLVGTFLYFQSLKVGIILLPFFTYFCWNILVCSHLYLSEHFIVIKLIVLLRFHNLILLILKLIWKINFEKIVLECIKAYGFKNFD